MKKHDEGYALAFVLVVVTVLCLVALSMMSIALQNMRSEQATVTRMQEKYAAQGEIEKVVAQMEAIARRDGGSLLWTEQNGFVDLGENAQCDIALVTWNDDKKIHVPLTEQWRFDAATCSQLKEQVLIQLTTGSDDAMEISCVLKVTGEINVDTTSGVIRVGKLAWSYAFYNIIEGGAADE